MIMDPAGCADTRPDGSNRRRLVPLLFLLTPVVAAAAPEDPGEGGQWGPVIDWPHIAVSAANLPDGRILTWSGSEPETWPIDEQTYSATWNPSDGTFVEIFHDGHNMFCAHLAMLEDGRVFVNGGRNQVNSPWTSIFDFRNDQWLQIENMDSGGRWYPTTLALGDGDIFTAIGTATQERYPERWNIDTGWQIQNGVDFNAMVLDDYFASGTHSESRWWPLLHVAPNGQVFHSGPTPKMHFIDTTGNGSYQQVGAEFTDFYHKHGTTVMYQEGKLLTAGGWVGGNTIASTNQAFTIDINGPSPVVASTGSMNFARKFHNGVILPTGEVLVIGGNTSGQKFSDNGAILETEIWDPDTGVWRIGAAMSVPRNYHSVALLLTDGRVLAAGSGYCAGNAFCNGASHKDGQVYSPPYLFDSNDNPAVRPTIDSGPPRISSGEVFDVQATPGIAEFNLIKMGSTTHGVNSDVRLVSVAFTETSAGNYELTAHNNQNVLTPGYWMLFALDAQGVPSVAHVVQANTSGMPWIATPPDQSSAEGSAVDVQFIGGDADDDPIVFSATGLPPGISLDPTTGRATGAPLGSGTFQVTVSVTDNDEGTRSKSFEWRVFAQGLGTIASHQWIGISGTAVSDLTSSPNYPDQPDITDVLSSFETATNVMDNYGTRVFGQLVTDVTGVYTFYIASDDGGELWLSTDETPDNKSLIALVPGWTSSQQWTKYAQQQSANITLQAGQRYFIEALQKEGGGGDNLAVGWVRPGSSTIEVIDGAYLMPYDENVGSPVSALVSSGIVENVGSGWITVLLDQTFSDMVVVASAQYDNTQLPAVTRVRNAVGDQFELKVQNPSNAALSGYTVQYIVAEAGIYSGTGGAFEAAKFVSTVTDQDSAWSGESRAYQQTYGNPVVVGQVMTENDPAWSVFWASDGTTGNPPSATSLSVGKHVAEDTAVTRLDETIGYFVFEAGTGQAGSFDFQAGVGTDTVRGVVDSQAPYVYALGSQGDVAVVSSAGMDGINGGWPVLYGTDPLANSALDIGIDEDQISDTERNRTTDQVAYLVLTGAVATPLTVEPITATPEVTGSTVTYTANATGTPLEYSWNFGDGQPDTPFSPDPNASHSYAAPGRYIVTVTVRNTVTQEEVTETFTQLIHWPLTAGKPNASRSILVHELQRQVWSVNPDNNSVSVIDTTANTLVAEIGVGSEPVGVALMPSGEIWVVNKTSASITRIDSSTLGVIATLGLSAASQPHGLVVDQVGGVAYVALEGTSEIIRLNAATGAFQDQAYIGGRIRHLSLTHDGSKLFVSRFVTPPLPNEASALPIVESGGQYFGGEVVVLDPADWSILATPVLRHSDRGVSEHTGPGVPNYLGPAVISPDGLSGWVPSKQDNILAGGLRGGQGMTFDQTVRAITSKIDAVTLAEDFTARIDHDNASVASDAAFGPYGAYLFTALEGNREVVVSDAYTATELDRFDTGRAPQGLAVSDDGTRLYVRNFMDRSVSVFDISEVTQANELEITPVGTVTTVTAESLAPQVLLGKQLFYDARDPRLALDSYMSCASCHNAAEQDGRVWDFTGMGEGLRNTIGLNGRAGIGHGPLHWSANFDEVQDFEAQIRTFSGGTGLMDDADFNAGTRSEPLGDPKAGISSDLDALAAYLGSLSSFRDSPHRNADGTLTADGEAGRQLFLSAGCDACHVAPAFTDSAPGTLHDVGTIGPDSGNRLGGPLTGIDTPTLLGIWQSEPYLHDGSAFDITEAINAHDVVSSLTAAEIDSLAIYLEQLDSVTASIGEPDPDPDPDPNPDPGGGTSFARFGAVTVSQPDAQAWHSVTFSTPLAVTPMVVMGPPSSIGAEPITMRVRNVTTVGFEYQIDEFDYLDGMHPEAETIGWIAVEPGVHDFGGLPAEAFSMSLPTAWIARSFSAAFATTPSVVCQTTTTNESGAAFIRQRAVTLGSVQLKLDEEENQNRNSRSETVHCLAVASGSGALGTHTLVAAQTPDQVTDAWYSVNFGASVQAPVLLGAISRTDGGDPSVLRYQGLTDSAVQVRVVEEQSRDAETAHTTEAVGWIVISGQ